MSRIKKTFVRLSRRFISHFLELYPELWNLVDCRYTQTFSWLKSCGAEFGDKQFMFNGVPFQPFLIRRA